MKKSFTFDKSTKLGTNLLDLYYFMLDTVPLKLPIISCLKNVTNKTNRKCINEAIKVLKRKTVKL